MPRFEVTLSPTIRISITIDAIDENDANNNWHLKPRALAQAKLAVAEEVKDLDDYEFDVEDVVNLEEED